MAITPTRTRDEWIALADAALETAIATTANTKLPGGIRTVSRAQTIKLLARRALRKATQGGMRAEPKFGN
jgi:hypothetical protein